MICHHGVWREGDCEICQLELKLSLAEQRIEDMEDVLKMIGDMAHDASCGPSGSDPYWTIRRLAYDAYIGTPPALQGKQ